MVNETRKQVERKGKTKKSLVAQINDGFIKSLFVAPPVISFGLGVMDAFSEDYSRPGALYASRTGLLGGISGGVLLGVKYGGRKDIEPYDALIPAGGLMGFSSTMLSYGVGLAVGGLINCFQ